MANKLERGVLHPGAEKKEDGRSEYSGKGVGRSRRISRGTGKEKKPDREIDNGWLDSLFHNDTLLKLMVAGIVVSVGLIFWGKGSGPDAPVMKAAVANTQLENNPDTNSKIDALEKALESKLADNLSRINGVGQVKVMVTLASSLKSDYGKNANVTSSTTEETDKAGGTRKSTQTTETDTLVLPNGSAQPVIIMQERPNIDGVLVVAEGAKDPGIREAIHTTVCTLLNVPANRVIVEAMGAP